MVLYSNTCIDHLSQVKELFSRLAAANLNINLAKYVEAKIEAICEFPVPQNLHDLRRFLGMAGYYRGFCSNFATVVVPLTDLLSTRIPFVLSEKCQEAFNNAKMLLATAPVLLAPNFNNPFNVAVDASESGTGAVLMQVNSNGIEQWFSKCGTRTTSGT